MKVEELFELAGPYLEKNDLGVAHTKRVFMLAKENFEIPADLEELVFASVVLHDIGGSTVKDQYEKGPPIAARLLRQLGYSDKFIQEVCEIIRTHHDHPENPSRAFRILYDSDKLVMFSPEEFPRYNLRPNFSWDGVIDLMYSVHSKELARKMLKFRRAGK